MENLYHADVYMPESAQVAFTSPVEHSPHAIEAAWSDRYAIIDLPTVVDTSKAKIIETAVRDGIVTKVVLRQPYDKRLDIVMVIDPRPSTPVLITAWLNRRNDKHRSLDTSKYSTN